jgi:hypothetical protein
MLNQVVHIITTRRRREDNIKMDFREIWYEGVDWNQLVRSREEWQGFVDTVMNSHVS